MTRELLLLAVQPQLPKFRAAYYHWTVALGPEVALATPDAPGLAIVSFLEGYWPILLLWLFTLAVFAVTLVRFRRLRKRSREEIVSGASSVAAGKNISGKISISNGSTDNLDTDVQFTAYRPSSVRPETWNALLVFMHKGGAYKDHSGKRIDPVEQIESQAKAIIGASMSLYGQVKADSSYPVARGSKLTFQPWLEKGRLNPPMAVLDWQEPVHRVEFRFLIPEEAEGSKVRGGVRIFSGMLLIGELQFSIAVTSDAPLSGGPSIKTRSIMYRKIFASYSHMDVGVVQSLIAHVETVGDRYLVDVRELRAGEVWSDRLKGMIREADIFQLFWSSNSMRSAFVRREWEYALGLGRDLFVRPVHWEEPLPEDPEAGLPPERLSYNLPGFKQQLRRVAQNIRLATSAMRL